MLTPVQIPASESPDDVATLIVDTAADAPLDHLVARIKARFSCLFVLFVWVCWVWLIVHAAFLRAGLRFVWLIVIHMR